MRIPSSHTIALLLAATVVCALVMVGATDAPGADPRRCEICGKSVHEPFYEVQNRVACPDCYARFPHCPGCGMPVEESRYSRLGEPVCEACAKRVGCCASCGDVLIGTYYPAKDDPLIVGFCEKCMKGKPKCALCGLPYPDLREVNDKLVCRRCLKKAERCETCGAPLVGKFFKIEFLDGKFCEDCIAKKSACDFCGRPIARDGVVLPDGRRTCGPCARSAVHNIDQARDLLERTIRYLASRHDMGVRTPFDFALVDSQAIALVAGHAERAQAAQSPKRDETPLRELGVFATRPLPDSPRPVILILNDLPVTAFLETVAHEYAHLWEFENGVDLMNHELAEGFAQWAASKWLLKNRLRAAQGRLEKRSDPIYGGGYRRIVEYESQNGTQNVLGWVRKQGAVSPGTRLSPSRDSSEPLPLAPLSQCLPVGALQGEYAFFGSAIVIQPAHLAEPHSSTSGQP